MLVKRLPDQPGVLEKAEYVDALVDRTIEAIHRIALDLRPSVLDFGLVEALAWQCNEFEQQNGTPCSFSSTARAVDLTLDRATAVFRIFQEALTNIAKHARAQQVEVSLQREAGGLVLAIGDDGVGIAPADRQKPGSFGLRGMAERAQALGGILAVAPGTTGGTVVTITVPFSMREQ
jgi:signal transduction histidine kinase